MAKTMCEPRLHPGLGKISHKKHLENNWRNLVDCINGDLFNGDYFSEQWQCVELRGEGEKRITLPRCICQGKVIRF